MSEKIYLVGGWVRDYYLRKELGMNVPEGDRDWVVVGARAQDLLKRGFRSVGKDFPVFLHPQTHEEYALARTERKVAPGYHGFTFATEPSVTLEQDLLRRDLTINAMALDQEQLIDPYHGLDDLRAKLLRHVSEAFAEDPVRILRVARFCARFPNFQIAPTTLALMRKMVENGEADALVGERIFKEFEKGLMQSKPSKMILALQACGLWQRLFPLVSITSNLLEQLDKANAYSLSLAQRFCLLSSQIREKNTLDEFQKQLKLPNECADLMRLCLMCRSFDMTTKDARTILSYLEHCDALRRPERFSSLLQVLDLLDVANPSTWLKYAQSASQINAAQIAAQTHDKHQIGTAIRHARLSALERVLNDLV